jgi:hypothetical protein
MAVVEPSFFHVPLWMLVGAYQPLGGMPIRVRREVMPPIHIHPCLLPNIISIGPGYRQPNTTSCTSSNRLWLAY